jgi:hypothetical protein
MKKLILIIPILFMSCKVDVPYSINKMKAPAVITVHKKSDQFFAHVIVRDANGIYWELYDDIFDNSKVGDTIKF